MAIDIHHSTTVGWGNSLLWKHTPIVYCGWRCLLMNTTAYILSEAIATDRQTLLVSCSNNVFRGFFPDIYGSGQWWSMDNLATPLLRECHTLSVAPKFIVLQLSIDRQRCQSVVVNNGHWLALYRVYCNRNGMFPFYCPGCKQIVHHPFHDANRPLSKASKCTVADTIDRQHCQSIVVDSGGWRAHFVAIVAATVYI